MRTVYFGFRKWQARTDAIGKVSILFLQLLRNYRRRALRHGFNRVARRATERWATLQDARYRERTKRSILARMRSRVLSSALKGWQEATLERMSNRHKVRLGVARMNAGLKGRSFRSWTEITDVIRARREAFGRLIRIRTRFVQRRAMLALRGWTQVCMKMLTMMRMLRKKTKLFYLIRWKDWDFAKKAVTKRKKRREVILLRSAVKLRQRLASRAFLSWKEGVTRRIRQRAAVARALGRMKRRRLAAALNSWTSMVQSRLLAKATIKKANASVRRRMAAPAFTALIENLFASRALEDDRVRKRIQLAKRKAMLKRFTARWRYRRSTRCFIALANLARESLRRKEQERETKIMGKIGNLIMHRHGRAVRNLFLTWHGNAINRIRLRRLMVGILLSKAKRSKVAAINTWNEITSSRRSQEERSERVKRIAATLAGSKRLKLARKALTTMRHNTLRRRRNRRIVVAAGAKWSRRLLTAALNGWKAEVARRREKRKALRRIVEILQKPPSLRKRVGMATGEEYAMVTVAMRQWKAACVQNAIVMRQEATRESLRKDATLRMMRAFKDLQMWSVRHRFFIWKVHYAKERAREAEVLEGLEIIDALLRERRTCKARAALRRLHANALWCRALETVERGVADTLPLV